MAIIWIILNASAQATRGFGVIYISVHARGTVTRYTRRMCTHVIAFAICMLEDTIHQHNTHQISKHNFQPFQFVYRLIRAVVQMPVQRSVKRPEAFCFSPLFLRVLKIILLFECWYCTRFSTGRVSAQLNRNSNGIALVDGLRSSNMNNRLVSTEHTAHVSICGDRAHLA